MGRRRDHKPDPRLEEREYIDPHTRQTVKIVTISASTHIEEKTKDMKLKPKWPSQVFARQRGKKSRVRRR